MLGVDKRHYCSGRAGNEPPMPMDKMATLPLARTSP
jgi:hypothetical protein